MNAAPLHPQETERLHALNALNILDTSPEKDYDELVQLAAAIFNVPIALISLIDANRQWFKSKVGIDVCETSRELAFCAHAILEKQILEIPNATLDLRFRDNPLVTGEPHVRFYAGAPLYTSEGLPLGTLCIIAPEPRNLSEQELNTLSILAKQVSHQLELRRKNQELIQQSAALTRTNQSLQELFHLISHDLRAPFQGFLGITELIEENFEDFTPQNIRSYVGMLGNSASETYNLLENLLSWSNLEQGILQYTPESLAAAKAADQSTRILSNALRKKHIQLINNVPQDLSIQADHVMLHSVIRNLVNNAIKLTPNNGNIRIHTSSTDQSLTFSITHSGPPLSPQQIETILNQESVSSSLGTSGERGSGVGLYLIHQFLNLHHTRLHLSSSPESGTTASFSLPLASA